MLRGGYVLSEAGPGRRGPVVLIATGSEVAPAVEAQGILAGKGIASRVVSMPSLELFMQQSEAFRLTVVPADAPKVVIEAGRLHGWERVAGDGALMIGLDRFGASAPYAVLAEKFGFTGPQIADRVQRWLGDA
jgi:transketolase